MSSFESLRDFISQRLTAAAAEIFSEFEKTIEEEVDHQYRLLETSWRPLETSWRPQSNINTTEVPQQHVYKEEEEVLADLHLCYKERNSSQDQNQPEPPQFEEEQKELFSSHQEEQLVLNQDTETSVLLQNMSRCEEKLEVIPQDLNQNQEEIPVRHRLLDISWNPEIRLQRIDLPQQHVCKEEEVLWDQERNSSLDQEEPELPQMKEEQEELCCSQEGEQLVLKQETDTFMLTPTDQERDFSEAEPNTEQLYSHYSPLTEGTNQEQSKNVPQSQSDTESSEKNFKCDVCGKAFLKKYKMLRHYRIHTGEKPYSCKICGRCFSQNSHLTLHMRIHTGEKPFSCKACGKSFVRKNILSRHMRMHTDIKPFECITCGEVFTKRGGLLRHLRAHTGGKGTTKVT